MTTWNLSISTESESAQVLLHTVVETEQLVDTMLDGVLSVDEAKDEYNGIMDDRLAEYERLQDPEDPCPIHLPVLIVRVPVSTEPVAPVAPEAPAANKTTKTTKTETKS